MSAHPTRQVANQYRRKVAAKSLAAHPVYLTRAAYDQRLAGERLGIGKTIEIHRQYVLAARKMAFAETFVGDGDIFGAVVGGAATHCKPFGLGGPQYIVFALRHTHYVWFERFVGVERHTGGKFGGSHLQYFVKAILTAKFCLSRLLDQSAENLKLSLIRVFQVEFSPIEVAPQVQGS